MDSVGVERRHPRVDRREAARILNCSRDNVRRMDRIGRLRSGKRDHNGTYTYDRREIEKIALERGGELRPSGELAARVFRMFTERKKFHEIVIETEQEPTVVLALWRQYQSGFETTPTTPVREHDTEHDEQMREMDREIEQRRRALR
jgi:DNA-binding transcriptional MerR regulator